MSSLGFNREVKLASGSWAIAAGVGLCVWCAGPAQVLAASSSQAASPPVSVSVDLDGDGRTETLSLDEAGTLAIAAGTGAGSRLALLLGERVPRLSDGRLTIEKLRGGETLVVATGLRGKGQRVALWARWRAGKLEPVYSGPIGPVGSDGEYSVVVEVSDGELFRYQTAPSVERCDGERRLFLERFFPDGDGKWQPAPDRLLAKPEKVAPLSTSPTGPSEFVNQPIGMYRIWAVSRQAGIERADLLSPPREVDDGQPQTVWRGPHDATGTFFTWRAESAGRSLRAVRIVPAPSAQGIMPAQLVLTLSSKQSFRIPTAGVAKPVWIVLPQPVPTDCVSLTIEQPGTKAGQHSALGDVNLYSDLDGGDAVALLIGQLGSTDTRSAEAAERTLRGRLESMRPEQIESLLQSLAAAEKTAKGSARRRIQGLLGTLAERSSVMGGKNQAALIDVLMATLQSAEVEERPALFSALTAASRSREPLELAVGKLELLLLDGKRSSLLRAEAAGWLCEHSAWPYPLQLGQKLTRETGLRTAFAAAMGRALHCVGPQDPRVATALSEYRRTDVDPAWLVLLGEGLLAAQSGCPNDDSRQQLAEKLGGFWSQLASQASAETRFALRYRLLAVLSKLDLPTVDPLVMTVLQNETEPDLRKLAARALGRSRTLDLDGVKRAVSDPDPGVRTALLVGLFGRSSVSGQSEALSGLLSPLLARDSWPMVRRAAAEVLGSLCQPGGTAQASLEQAVADAEESVAAASLAGLARCVGAQGISRYQSLLLDEKTMPSVRGQACVLVARFGLGTNSAASAHRAIGDGLSDLLDDPHGADRSLVAALLCIRALGEHGDDVDIALLMGRLDRDAPLALRRGAADSLLRICQRQKTPLGKNDRQSLGELLKRAGDPSDALLHGLQNKLQRACGPLSSVR